MRKKTLQEWTCDRCGKTFVGNRVFRPYGVRSAKICVDLDYNLLFRRKYEFCPECADGLVNVIKKYVDQEYLKWHEENVIE